VPKIDKEEARAWRENPTTREILNRIGHRLDNLTEFLQEHAGETPVTDARVSGMIRGYKDVLELAEGDEDEMEPGGIHNPD
jgi:hypothetical protein